MKMKITACLFALSILAGPLSHASSGKAGFGLHGNIGFMGSSAFVMTYGGGLNYRASDSMEFAAGVNLLSSAGATIMLIPLDANFYLGSDFYLGPSLSMTSFTGSWAGTTLTGTAFGAGIQLGYDFWVSPSFAVRPEARMTLVGFALPVYGVTAQLAYYFN